VSDVQECGNVTIPGLMQPTPLTLRSIFDRMRTVYAEGEIVSPEARWTYGESAERILRLARALTDELGVRPGDRVATFAVNSARHFELYWAVPLVGAVLHTVNVRLHPEQIAYICNHARDRVMFVDGALTSQMAEIVPELDTIESYVSLGDPESGTLAGLRDHDALIGSHDPLARLPEVDENAGMGLCYTSGTTGMPKGVLYSHRAMWLHSIAASMTDHIGISEADRVLPIVPMFHAFAWSLPYAAPMTGAELVFHGADNSPDHLADVIEREQVTLAAGVPTIWKSLLPLYRDGRADPSSLRLVFVGGSASPRALIEAYDDLGVEYLQVWGMTETGPLASAARPRRRHRQLDRDAQLDVREKTGTIFAGLEARIVDDRDVPLPWDGAAVGELEVRGPWIASAYYRDDVGSEARFHDGWLRTGDMAYIEPDGYFRIIDRAKDLVKSGGEWISSVELEGHVLAHPGVAEAAVVGVASRRWDERPVVTIVAEDGREAPTLTELRTFLTDRVPKWWLPDHVVVVDDIPKTSVGKLDKRGLREQLGDLELP
jgi:fatty-acyl-CoA synthase